MNKNNELKFFVKLLIDVICQTVTWSSLGHIKYTKFFCVLFEFDKRS